MDIVGRSDLYSLASVPPGWKRASGTAFFVMDVPVVTPMAHDRESPEVERLPQRSETLVNVRRVMLGGLLAGSVIVVGEIVRQTILTEATPASGGSMPLGVFILIGFAFGWAANQFTKKTN